MLESTYKKGNTINSEHIRCRGIPTACITYNASQDKLIALDIYNIYIKVKVIEFDLIKKLCLQK